MHRNAIWIGFLLIVVGVALWFVVKTGYDVYSYFQLNTQVPIKIEKWSVQEVKADQFLVNVHYSYDYQGKSYTGVGSIGSKYPNPWAANRAQQQFVKQEWSIWIHPKHPEKGMLEKKFPYKTAISALVLLGLTIYFFVLGTYVRAKSGR